MYGELEILVEQLIELNSHSRQPPWEKDEGFSSVYLFRFAEWGMFYRFHRHVLRTCRCTVPAPIQSCVSWGRQTFALRAPSISTWEKRPEWTTRFRESCSESSWAWAGLPGKASPRMWGRMRREGTARARHRVPGVAEPGGHSGLGGTLSPDRRIVPHFPFSSGPLTVSKVQNDKDFHSHLVLSRSWNHFS